MGEGLGFRVSGLGFLDSGFGFLGSGLGVRVWGLGIRVWITDARTIRERESETLTLNPLNPGT